MAGSRLGMPGNRQCRFRPAAPALRAAPARPAARRPPAPAGTRRVDRAQPSVASSCAGGERADRHGAEDQEIVERLDLVALLRAVALGHHRGGADEGEVPADAEQRERRSRNARPMCRPCSIAALDEHQRQPEQMIRNTPNRTIRLPVMKLGAYMPSTCHCDAERRVGDRMAAADHGERRRGHHQVHHRRSCDAADHRDDEARRARDLRQRPAAARAPRAASAAGFEQRQHQARERGQHGLRDDRSRQTDTAATGPW